MTTSTQPRTTRGRAADAPLVARVRAGDRGAFAVLYLRHVDAVYVQAIEQGLDPVRAARLVRAVFGDAQRELPAIEAAGGAFGTWVRSRATDRAAAGPGGWPRLRPATAAAARGTGVLPSSALRDALWRELDEEWRLGQRSLWERHGTRIAGTAALTALVAAVAVVGSMVLEELRPVTPAAAVELRAEPLTELSEPPAPPPVAPSVIVPPVPVDEPDPEPEPEPEPTPTESAAPSPTPEPTPEPTEPSTEPAETDAPPTAEIHSPADGQQLQAQQADDRWVATVDLAGSGDDAEDDAAGLALTYVWVSDRDGQLAAAPTAAGVQLSFEGECPVAGPTRHTITLTVTDSAGNTATASATVTITCPVLGG